MWQEGLAVAIAVRPVSHAVTCGLPSWCPVLSGLWAAIPRHPGQGLEVQEQVMVRMALLVHGPQRGVLLPVMAAGGGLSEAQA